MIHQQIKDDLKQAMKEKLPEKEFIKVVLSEFSRVGKELSDEEALKELTRLKKTAVAMKSAEEIKYLDKYLPKMMGEDEIETQIMHYIDSGIDNIGQIMGAFNQQFRGKADNRLVSQIAKKLLNT